MRNLYILILVLMISPALVLGQSVMSSDEYKMQSDSINFAGSIGSSTNYQLSDTLGEGASGQVNSTNYSSYLGFQFMGFADPDTEDPTAPASLTAEVVSSSEIELTWSASTDNIAVDRYYIYRDGVRIDDVAIFPRSFNDTGLSANTTYSYNVSAVDDSNNESARSATTTATTLAESTSLVIGGSRTVFISNFTITSNDTNAAINFDTSLSRIAEIHFGTNSNYTSGIVVGALTDKHSFILNNLLPDTFYQLKIVLKDEYGNARSFENISFRTLSTPLSASPVNVYSFDATHDNGAVRLSWLRPADNRVTGFTIIRSEDAYPSSIRDGSIIYEGSGGSFVDTNVEAGKEYFYTIFTEDLAGNTSSGVVASAYVPVPGEPVLEITSPLERLKDAKSVDPLIERLVMDDFLFIQRGDSVDVNDGLIEISADQNTTVAIKYYRLPSVLKTIAVTLITQDESKKNFTFILRPNRDKTRYEATIGPLGDLSNYKIRIDVVDYKNQGLKTLFGEVRLAPPQESKASLVNTGLVSIILVSLIVLILILVLVRKIASKRRLPLIDVSSNTLSTSPK